ncbi:hypothetical protein [Salipiger abyssi]|uniref:hypothetical protein n=1 Tax=Salipiger abyssi TaxID=1250539 RepID=UPI001A8CFDE0|nr:hypothetical protein [Salipiger abyssi]MBN9887757.1 hypothetical protein [Salipiger abyssi]
MLQFAIGLFLGLLIMVPAVAIVLCAARLTHRAETQAPSAPRWRLKTVDLPGR